MAGEGHGVEDRLAEDQVAGAEGFRVEDPGQRAGEVEVAPVLRGAPVHAAPVELDGVSFHVRHGDGEAPVEMLAAVGAEDAEFLEAGADEAARLPVGLGDPQPEGVRSAKPTANRLQSPSSSSPLALR